MLTQLLRPLLQRSEAREAHRASDLDLGLPIQPQHQGWLGLLAADPRRLQSEYARQSRHEGLCQPTNPDLGRLLFENRVYRWALRSQVREQAQRLSQLLLRAIRTLAHALEARDAYTWGHSARVSRYAALISRQLDLADAEVAMVSLGGELHDIGKIGVPDDLLLKAGPLTPEEYRQVMEHTVIGDRILRPLLHNQPDVLSIVRSHHERLDGSSLPDGLSGDSIPLAARIVAVADAFDAMTSVRPYRRALTVHTALNELIAHSGTQFDAACVEAMVGCSDALELKAVGLTQQVARARAGGPAERPRYSRRHSYRF